MTETHVRELEEALDRAVRGEVRFDGQSRALYSMDASNFRHTPIGVVVPADEQDVVEAVRVCRRHHAPIVSRGGGTGLAGQSLNVAVVLDHSKLLRGVIGVDARNRTARVRAGTILDTLRSQTRPLGLTYGPDPSTHDRCTFGGMIGNNACGVHAILSEFYGPGPRTEDNVASMQVLTYDGLRLEVGPTGDAQYEAIIGRGGREAEIYRGLRGIVDRHAAAIRGSFPAIPRRVSGYNLPALLPENGFDVAKALVGTEGTCATVLEATVRLCRHFPERALLLLGYGSVFEAGDDVPRIRELKPIGLEGIDDRLVRYIKAKHMHPGYTDILPEGDGWLIAEFGGDTKEEAADRAREGKRRLSGSSSSPHAVVIEDETQQRHLWEVRESALGATAFVPDQHDTWPGWEDSAVPVEGLGDYLRRLEELYDRYDYTGAVYGHFGQGCVHTRISFDLTSEEGVGRYRDFTREAAELCVSHGGSLSGEHGDGQQRSDLLPVMYGPEILEAFGEFKRLWDPDGRMNPGRIVDPLPRDRDLRLVGGDDSWSPATRFAFPEDGGDFSHAALRCVGVGKCRADGDIMCPSYMVTHEEEHTTRGRARLLFEMIRGDVVSDHWASREVKEALDLCLACKGCKHDCPVNVDMATYKAEFLSHYYEKKARPRQAYALGMIHRWVRLGSALPRLANLVTGTFGLRGLAKRIAGVAPERTIPGFAPASFRSSFRPAQTGSGRRVLLWPDCFNNAFYPDTLEATAEVLRSAGFDVAIPPRKLCCGRALYDYGLLDEAVALWRETLDTLAPEIEAGTPLIGAEPSCVTAFRDELPNLFPGDERAKKLSGNTHALAAFLLNGADGYRPPALSGKAIFHGHCHQKSILGTGPDHELLRRMGLVLEVPERSCCGMAGSFGFEADKYDISKAIAEQRLLPAVRAASRDTYIVADGFSCREQVGQLGGRRPMHLAELIRTGLRAQAPAGAARGAG